MNNIASIMVTLTDGTTAEFVLKSATPTEVINVVPGESVEVVAEAAPASVAETPAA